LMNLSTLTESVFLHSVEEGFPESPLFQSMITGGKYRYLHLIKGSHQKWKNFTSGCRHQSSKQGRTGSGTIF